jgi:hypothetical protein
MVIHRDRSRCTYRSAKHEPSIEQILTSDRCPMPFARCAWPRSVANCGRVQRPGSTRQLMSLGES